jgi:hypothetical protein
MNPSVWFRGCIRLLTVIAAVVLIVSATAAQGTRFFSDDPLTREPETQDASRVEEWEIDLFVDLTINLFGKPGDSTPNVRARDINTIDEVPDSNWFTNRLLTRTVTPEEAARGPVEIEGPAPGRWTVVAPKRAGVSPGFTMRDAKGEIWFVSFDAPDHPDAATGAIMVANKIFWTLGYWQVENHVIKVRPQDLEISPEAMFTPPSGRRRPLKQSDIDEVFRRSHRSEDGTYRAAVGRGVPGRAIGGFKYHGTRPDDPNDVVPHEHRRSLRALQVFGAWTNLVDMKAGNTLDTVISQGGRAVVRHYLQDVGSTFGTGALAPHQWDEGWEYLYEGGQVAQRLFLLGFPLRPWHTAPYADNEAIGRFEGEAFEPEEWKPRVPVAALRHARLDDTFWAARRLAAFTDDMIRAVAKTGQYSVPSDEKLLADVLIQRRNKIVTHYMNAVNPLVDFALSGDGRLRFRNAAVDAGAGNAPSGGYRATWASFDNATSTTAAIGAPVTASGLEIQAPAGLPSGAGAFVKVDVAAVEAAQASWAVPVSAYFRRTGSEWSLVGLDRLPAPAPAAAKP